MSTRANIKIQDSYNELYFYRHSDGYPEVTFKSLKGFVNFYKDGKFRNNVSQSAGWLILWGAIEYENKSIQLGKIINNNEDYDDWKVGSYEPTTCMHGDVEYFYVIDLVESELRAYEVVRKIEKREEWGEANEKLTLKGKPIQTYSFKIQEKESR